MGLLSLAPGVALVDEEDVTYLATIPWGPIVVLDGVAPTIWRVARGSAREDVPRRVAEETGADLDEIRGDVDRFLADLLERGLLVETAV